MAIAKTRLVAQPPKRTCRDFIEYWSPLLRLIDQDAELDYSFHDDAVTVTDMRIPAKLRTGVLYTKAEVEAGADYTHGDFEKRLARFMAQAIGLK